MCADFYFIVIVKSRLGDERRKQKRQRNMIICHLHRKREFMWNSTALRVSTRRL